MLKKSQQDVLYHKTTITVATAMQACRLTACGIRCTAA